MPIRYEIDQRRNLIRTSCVGFVRLEDVIEHFAVLRADPNRPGHADLLLDLTQLVNPPEGEQLRTVAAHLDADASLSFRRAAIVADRDVVFGIARMFQVLAEKSFGEMRVFRSIGQAEAWLAEPSPPRHTPA